jgi:hypothetical protein
MKNRNKKIFFLLMIFVSNSLYSQIEFSKLKTAYVQNTLSYSQYLEYSALNLFEPNKVPLRYRVGGDIKPLKSGTFIVQEIKNNWQRLDPNIQQALAKYLSRYDLQHSILSPSGRFRLHYDVTGYNAVDTADRNRNGIPDYIDSASTYFEYAHYLLVDSLGYNPPAPDSTGQGKEFDIYFIQISGAYGITYLEELIPGRGNAYSCYMQIENDYRGFQTPALGSLKVTSVHEYYHAVQVTYAFRDEDIFFMEMSSTWMEDFAHAEVNDYLFYLNSFFNKINYPFSYSNGGYEYGAALWNHMIVKKYHPDLIRDIWTNIRNEIAMTSIPKILAEYNTTFNDELISFGIWNYFTAERNDSYNFYPEGDLYPSLRFAQEITFDGDDLSLYKEMSKLSSIYYQISDLINNLDIGLIVTNLETPSKAMGGNFDVADKDSFSIDLISLTEDQPPGDEDFFLQNNLVKLTDRFGIRLNITQQENWNANAVVTLENGAYEIVQFFPVYSTNGNAKRNFIETAYPNPLVIGKNDPLIVKYVISDEKAGELNILSSDGRLMKKYQFNAPKYNYHIFQWDGRNQNGNMVSSGIYVLVLRVGNSVDMKKIAIIRN